MIWGIIAVVLVGFAGLVVFAVRADKRQGKAIERLGASVGFAYERWPRELHDRINSMAVVAGTPDTHGLSASLDGARTTVMNTQISELSSSGMGASGDTMSTTRIETLIVYDQLARPLPMFLCTKVPEKTTAGDVASGVAFFAEFGAVGLIAGAVAGVAAAVGAAKDDAVEVDLGDPEFAALFKVVAKDQPERVKDLLNPDVRRFLMANPAMSLESDRHHLVLHCGKDGVAPEQWLPVASNARTLWQAFRGH